MNIHDVLGLGHIVFGNEELGVLITANGSYLNWFNEVESGLYVCSTCRSTAGKPFYEMTMRELGEVAEKWFEEEMSELEEQEVDLWLKI